MWYFLTDSENVFKTSKYIENSHRDNRCELLISTRYIHGTNSTLSKIEIKYSIADDLKLY